MADESKPKPAGTNGAADPKAAAKLVEAANEKAEEGEESEKSGTTSDAPPIEETPSIGPPSSSRFDKKRPSGKSPWPSRHKSGNPGAVSIVPPDAVVKADWGEPLAKLDRVWTKLEVRLATGVLLAEVLTLVFWISVRALSTSGHGGAGMVFRSMAAALVFGVAAWLATKSRPDGQRITTIATLVGFVVGTRLDTFGTSYVSNLFAWLQNSSILVFVGGVSELARRLTLWLALLGASLATAQGKHINVDVAMRFLAPRARVPVAVLGWVAAAIVSITASYGFFDYVCVEELRSPPTIACAGDASKRCPTPVSAKIDLVLSTTSRDLFLVGRQLSLDVRSLPRVLVGTPYNKWLKPAEWNEWLRGGSWESHFNADDVKAFELPEDGSVEFRNPSVTAIPGGNQEIPGLLVPLFNFVFAFGLLVIGVRFILRSLLAISGWVKVDPAAAHGDDELAHAHDHTPAAELAEAAIKGTHT